MLPPSHTRRKGSRLPLTQHGEGRGAMRKRLLVLLMAVMMVVMSAAPALAAKGGTDRPRPGIPLGPPGTGNNPHENRPAHAVTPMTGPLNQFCHSDPLFCESL